MIGAAALGLTVKNAAHGLYSAAAGKVLNTSGDQRIGLGTNGVLKSSFTVPAIYAGANTDYQRVIVQDLNPFLIGTVAGGEVTSLPRPDVRHEESIGWLLNGQAVMGAAARVLRSFRTRPPTRSTFIA